MQSLIFSVQTLFCWFDIIDNKASIVVGKGQNRNTNVKYVDLQLTNEFP